MAVALADAREGQRRATTCSTGWRPTSGSASTGGPLDGWWPSRCRSPAPPPRRSRPSSPGRRPGVDRSGAPPTSRRRSLERCTAALLPSMTVSISRTCSRARSETSTTPATTGSCSWRPTGSRPSTSCMPEPIPDKGRVLTAMSAFWFERLADVVRQPPDLRRHRRSPRRRVRRAGPCSAAGRRCCRSSASSAATSPARPGRSTARDGHHARRVRCPPGCVERPGSPSRCSRRRPRRRSASTTRTSLRARRST